MQKKTSNPKSKIRKSKKKDRSVFPPPQTPRKEDLEMESGQYFLNKAQKDDIARKELEEKKKIKVETKKNEKKKAYIAPKEKPRSSVKSEKEYNIGDSVNKLVEKEQAKVKKRKLADEDNIDNYLVAKKKQKKGGSENM